MTTIARAVEAVRGRVAQACERGGRDASGVRIVAVSKAVDPATVAEVVDAGITEIGANRARDVADNAALVPAAVHWHYVGALQTNKVRYLDTVSCIQSLARVREASALQARGERSGRGWDVLVEVNVAGEASKGGVTPEDAETLLEGLDAYPLVRPRGIMIVAPLAENPEDVRWVFVEARHLRDRLREQRPDVRELSMGMSDDFEVAVEEGATLVRIGRAIFRRG